MTTLHIEHDISDYATWSAAFERYSHLRKEHRVRSYDVHQPIDNPRYVMIRLELDSVDDANALLARLREIWASREATPALRSEPRVSIMERKARATVD